MKSVSVAALSVALAIGIVACSDKHPSALEEHPDPLAGVVVSNAHGSSSAISSAGVRTSLAVSVGALAYVSAAPATFPAAISAVIHNQTKGGAFQLVQVVAGGFDPVVIEAAVGDELSLTLYTAGGSSAPMVVKVPPRRPPVVVRTNPSKGRTDVALTVLVSVVFSEPVDRSSVTPSSLSLLHDGNTVSGRIQVSADGLSADFISDAPLQPLTSYDLVIGAGINDLDGDALGATSTIPFTTESTPAQAVGTIIVTIETTATTSSDFDPDGYDVAIEGQPARRVGVNGTVTTANLVTGTYAVTLSGLSANCTLSGNPIQPAVVSAGATTTLTFRIACASVTQPGQVAAQLAFVSERDGNSEIYAINVDGTGLVRLTNNLATDMDPAWSPDGKRIAFASTREAGANPYGSDIYAMDADGSNVVRLTIGGTNSAPSWSPDGRKIAFSGLYNGQGGIFVMSLEDPAKLASVGYDRGYQTDPAWSPDGSKIAFTSDWRAFDFLFDLYVAKADGSGITMLLAGPFFSSEGLTFYFQPAWSPDGLKMAVVVCTYASDTCYPNSTIMVANANGSGMETLVAAGGMASPTWSPDGGTIAYSSRPCRDCVGSLRYIKLDGAQTALIFANGHSPSWRP